jgi:hypothetical protein
MVDEIPEPTSLSWWQKNSVQIEMTWNLTPGGIPLRNWLFDYQGAYLTYWKNQPVFWLRGWVRILGIFIGGGIFITRKVTK